MLQTNTRNFDFREFQRVHFKTEVSEVTPENIENGTEPTTTKSKIYTDIRIDLYTVIAYGHYYNAEDGQIDHRVTEIFIDGILTPILIRKRYFEFNIIMSGLAPLNP